MKSPKRAYPYLYFLFFIFFLFPDECYSQTKEYQQLKSQLSTEKDSLKYVDILNQISFLAQIKSPDSCLFYSLKAKTISNRLEYEKGKADALNNIAIAFTLKNVHKQALFFYSRAFIHYQKTGNIEAQAQMLLNSAAACSALHDTVQKSRYIHQAFMISQKASTDALLGNFFADYVAINTELTTDSINYFLNRAEKIGIKYNNQYLLLHLRAIRAQEFLYSGKPNEALPYIQNYLDRARKNQWEYHYLEGLKLMGQYQTDARKLDLAIQTYTQVLKTSKMNGYKRLETDALRSLLTLYQEKRSIEKIISTQNELTISLEQTALRNNTILGDFSAFMISSQQIKNRKNQEALFQQKINALLLVITLITLSLVLIIVLYKKTRKKGKRLAELNQTVHAQNLALLSADKFKGKLISMLAHDYRSPIGSILSIIAMLKEGQEIPKAQLEKFYTRIEQDLSNVLTAFDHTLEWIKAQLPGYIFSPQPLQTQLVMEQTVALVAPAADLKELRINNLIAPDSIIGSDPEILHFINRNLLNNAIKYSPQKGIITITLESTTKETIISIQDQGPGVDADDLERIFTFDPDRKSINNGAGLALSICNEMIQKINGRIWAEHLETQGTVFKYALPISA